MVECGVRDDKDDRAEFIYHFTKSPPPGEWRFSGALGFGGKLHTHPGWWVNSDRCWVMYVDYYREDETPERRNAMEKANARLAEGPQCNPNVLIRPSRRTRLSALAERLKT